MTSYPYHIDNLKYEDFSTAVQATVSLQTTTTLILAASAARQWAYIQNLSVSQVQISFQNSTATIGTNLGIKLTADNGFLINSVQQGGIYTGAIYGKAPTTARPVSVIYYNRV